MSENLHPAHSSAPPAPSARTAFFGRPTCRQCAGTGVVGAGAECPGCYDVVEQARDWLATKCDAPRRDPRDPQDSHAVVFGAACCVVKGFNLQGVVAFSLLREYCGRSDRRWSDQEIQHKLAEAGRAGGQVGHLIFTRPGFRGPGNVGGGSGADSPTPGNGNGPGHPGNGAVFHDGDPVRYAGQYEKALPFDRAALEAVQVKGVVVDDVFLRARSVAWVPEVSVEDFLCGLYRPGERILVFTKFRSQGDFCYEVGVGWWRLGPRVEDKKVGCERPRLDQPEGVWYLAQPVSGGWNVKPGSNPREYTRRDYQGVTAWRYMVVESDEKDIEPLWLNALAQLRIPIVAMYTSGGKSVHALVRVNAESKDQWEEMRGVVRPLLTKLGADRAVFSGVRLTRLPGFLRLGTGADSKEGYRRFPKPRLQRLLYWNPEAGCQPILTLPVRFPEGCGGKGGINKMTMNVLSERSTGGQASS